MHAKEIDWSLNLSLSALFMAAGTFRGVCKKIDHFPEDADYEQDAAEYLLRKSVKTAHIRGEARHLIKINWRRKQNKYL